MAQMVSGNTIAEVAALIGEPARANILLALMDGRALSAGELAEAAAVSAQTTSGHLNLLREGGLIAVERQGRHRYYRLAGPEVARLIEAVMAVAAVGPARFRPVGPKDMALRTARTCYDHIAGRLGIGLADALVGRGAVVLSGGAALVTASGHSVLRDFGLDLAAEGSKRILCRACLDWSERRAHLGGRLGAGILTRALDLGWVARVPDSRALRVEAAGERGFATRFGLAPGWRSGLDTLAQGPMQEQGRG